MRFGGLEVLFVLMIVLLFFGPKQLPKVTAAIKDSIASFKEGNKEEDKDKKEVSESVKDEA